MNRNDVAKFAKVSPSTVTRALNDHRSIPAATRDRLKKIAAKFDYVPSHLGRSHYQKKSFRLGVVIPYDYEKKAHPLPSEYFSKLLFGILHEAAKAKYTINLIADNNLSAEELARAVLSHSVDGLIMFIRKTGDSRYAYLHKNKIPFILVHDYVPGKPYLHVDCDPQSGMEEAFKYLVSRNIKDAGYLTGGNDYMNSLDRTKIFRQLAEKYDITISSIIDGDFSRKSGLLAAKEFLKKKLPRVIMCANDRMAFGLIEGLRQSDIKVPADVGAIGFDNQDAANIAAFNLSTIENPFFEAGELAAKKLIEAIDGEKPKSALLASKFILRESL
ncbi:MAG: hypothetical protein A3J83_01825 [Elusimicrobia bacterium RIFOXYA2_FULL_40_6]|nr:MAG: hypothetical protein A3J83_01825 [Elusimicrobia bacterium RIFOXYA2_FULL_40_6]